MPKSKFVTSSEKNLLSIHNDIAVKLKAFKRLFIKKGLMMRTFEYINGLHARKDYVGISEMIGQLYSDLPPHWTLRYHKYMELIDYCSFLEYSQYKMHHSDIALVGMEVIASLNMSHELGRAIEAKIRSVLCSI
jgi:hypothetical protein